MARVVWAHLGAVALEFSRGCALSLVGLLAGRLLVELTAGQWPIGLSGTFVLLTVGASLTAGAFVGTLGGWRKRGVLFGAGFAGFLFASLIL